MTTLTAEHPRAHAVAGPLPVAAAALVLGTLLSFLGLAWDVQWHSDVGPDTFFTLPHLVLYSGIATTGLAALAAVLWWAGQVPRAADGIGGVIAAAWRAPLGFVIAGVGAAVFLVYGFYDLWWHEIYGFDVTFESPPHIGLLIGMQIAMVGTVVVYAAQVWRVAPQRALAPPVLGLCLAVAVALGGSVPFLTIVPPVFGPLSLDVLALAALYTLALLLVSAVVRRPGAAILLALVFVALRTIAAVVVQWATPQYATALNLFLRDDALGFAYMPAFMPPAMLLAALAVDAVLLAMRRRGGGLRTAVLVAGALAASTLVVGYQPVAFGAGESNLTALRAATRGATLLLAPLVGVAAAWLGWTIGVLMTITRNERIG